MTYGLRKYAGCVKASLQFCDKVIAQDPQQYFVQSALEDEKDPAFLSK